MPDLSIIIVTWNTADITLKCIQSLKANLKKLSYEVIVVDNNSNDNTKQLLSIIKNIKYIQNSDNLGFSKANNIGASKATGKFLLFLNSDMLLIDDSLNLLIKYYQQNPSIGIIGPQFLNPDLSPQASVFPPQSIINALKEYWLKIPLSFSKYIPKLNLPSKVWAISGGAMLISRQLFEKNGGWNESYFLYFEDLDLCQKIRKIGKDIIYFPKSKIIHYHGSSGKNLINSENQWRRLIPGSITYHGRVKHNLLYLILLLGKKLFK